jgi:YD repeat-containing protein
MFGRHFWYGALCVTLLTIAVLMTQAKAQSNQRTFYDTMGRTTGRAVTNGNTTQVYDNMGRSTGRATTNPNTGSTTIYDNMGRTTGRVSR